MDCTDRGGAALVSPSRLSDDPGAFGDFLGCMRGQRVGFDSKALAKVTGSAWYSSACISRELGYRPLISFEPALLGIIAWYRETLA